MRISQVIIISTVFLLLTARIPQESICMAGGYVIPAEDFMYIPPGTYTMGDNNAYWPDEKPEHQVTISHGFGMQKHEVTQGQWFAVMGTRPWLKADDTPKDGVKTGDYFPAVYISWSDDPPDNPYPDNVQNFIQKLNTNAGSDLFRLPTEAEWEYACRAGTTTSYSFGDDDSVLGDYGWFKDNAEGHAHEIEEKKPNPWCLFDMHGNVWEWCSDWYSDLYYTSSQQTDPMGPEGPLQGHVVRGGSFNESKVAFQDNADSFRSARRAVRAPLSATGTVGFRLVRTDIQPRRPELSDLVPVLQICAGADTTPCMLHADINRDGRIDLIDAISIIQSVSGSRN